MANMWISSTATRFKGNYGMKMIVTGGAGFIGGNFVHHMVNKYPEYDIMNLVC